MPYKKTAEELTLVNSLLTLRLSRKQGEAVANFRRRDLFLWCSAGDSGGGSVITDAEIKALSETLYVLDSNKALPSQLIIDPQALVSDSQTSSKTDLSSRRWHWQCTLPPHHHPHLLSLWHYPHLSASRCLIVAFSLFEFLDESSLFSKPTYAAFLALLDNYKRMTGETEKFTSQQLAEQDTFLTETMSNTELGRELFAFLYTKGSFVDAH